MREFELYFERLEAAGLGKLKRPDLLMLICSAFRLNRPNLIPEFIQDKNGHILPFVRFEGGRLELSETVFEVLQK